MGTLPQCIYFMSKYHKSSADFQDIVFQMILKKPRGNAQTRSSDPAQLLQGLDSG